MKLPELGIKKLILESQSDYVFPQDIVTLPPDQTHILAKAIKYSMNIFSLVIFQYWVWRVCCMTHMDLNGPSL